MAIYNSPKEIKNPDYNKDNWEKEEKRYIKELKDFCIKRNQSKYVGEIICFPIADGEAQYMVASLKPVQLIHLEICDGYEYPYIHKLNAKDIREEIIRQKNGLIY